MTSVLDSVDNMIESINIFGAYRRLVGYNSTGQFATVPTATAGGPQSIFKTDVRLVVPTMNSPVVGMYLLSAKGLAIAGSGLTGAVMLGLEYKLGSLNLATSVFTAGVTMPVKAYSGQPAVQSSSQLTTLGVDSVLTATTPTITVTYTDQDGNTGQTGALILPTSAGTNSHYVFTPSLAAGDTGIREVTNMTKSAGTVGIVSVYGYLFLSASLQPAGAGAIEPNEMSYPLWLCESGDVIQLLGTGSTSVTAYFLHLFGVAET